MPDAFFLRTARLGFRRWDADDLPLARALWADAAVTRLIGGPFSSEQVAERLEREMETMRTHQVQYWPIFLLQDGAHVGCCGLRPFDPKEDTFELGFHLRPAYWRRGLAVEAGRAVVGYAFATLRARRLLAGHHPANAPSRIVLERLGFRFTGERFYAPTRLYHRSYLLDPGADESSTT